jgi:hypothetical protein
MNTRVGAQYEHLNADHLFTFFPETREFKVQLVSITFLAVDTLKYVYLLQISAPRQLQRVRGNPDGGAICGLCYKTVYRGTTLWNLLLSLLTRIPSSIDPFPPSNRICERLSMCMYILRYILYIRKHSVERWGE